MKTAVLAFGASSKLVTPLLAGLDDKDLFFSFGKEIPDLSHYDKVSYWMGGAYALKLQTIGLATGLVSPGANWLPKLEYDLLQRDIVSSTFEKMGYFSGKRWVKPAEAKIVSFPAGVYTYNQLEEIVSHEKIANDVEIQWTDSVLDIDLEHRFFVVNGKVLTGSPYRVHEILYSPGISFDFLAKAQEFAEFALGELGDNIPSSFTLDVGYDKLSKNWLIIEGNRSWSSGFYGCDAKLALTAVQAAAEGTDEKWLWKPDAHLALLNKDYEFLVVKPADSNSYGFSKFEKN